jgi:shikimate kinase
MDDLMVAAILITGNPGSGKSSLASELARRGYAAIDGDEIAGWETLAGRPASRPEEATDEWLLSHRWMWSRSRIEAVVREHTSSSPYLFVCGIAFNQRETLDLFELIFLLSLDHETQVERLNAPANAHRTRVARAQILDGRAVFEREMQAVGAIALDARQPIPILASRILRELVSRS